MAMERGGRGMSAGSIAESFADDAERTRELLEKRQALAVVLAVAWFDPATGELHVSNNIFNPVGAPHMRCVFDRVVAAIEQVRGQHPPCPNPGAHREAQRTQDIDPDGCAFDGSNDD